MSSTPIELVIEGRVVCGHPLRRNLVTKEDPETKRQIPVMDLVTGLQKTESYLAVAIPKNGSTDWRQTPWGAQIAAKALADWPNGEHGSALFAWKITDGDSVVPNRVGKKPCDREGWPGHWVMHLSTQFAIQCYNVGNYDPLQQITDENAIKTGDYCRVSVGVRGNNPSQSPGVYINPRLFELARAGEPIISESGPSAATVFGGAGATTVATPAAATVPAAEAAPEVKYVTADGQWTEAQLLAAGYPAAQIQTFPRA